MPEPTSSIAFIAATAAGLTVFGVATGINPSILLAGLAGGMWSLSYQPPMSVWRRAAVIVCGAVVAAYLTPIAVAVLASFSWWPASASVEMAQLPLALLIGLLAYKVIGPSVLRIAARKAEEAEK